MNHPSSKKECARSGAQAALQTGVYDLIMISVSTIVKLCQIDQSIIMWVPNERLFILRALCKQLAHAASPRLIPNAHDEMQIKRPLNCFHFNLFDFSSNNFQMPTKKKDYEFCCFLFSYFFFHTTKWNPLNNKRLHTTFHSIGFKWSNPICVPAVAYTMRNACSNYRQLLIFYGQRY